MEGQSRRALGGGGSTRSNRMLPGPVVRTDEKIEGTLARSDPAHPKCRCRQAALYDLRFDVPSGGLPRLPEGPERGRSASAAALVDAGMGRSTLVTPSPMGGTGFHLPSSYRTPWNQLSRRGRSDSWGCCAATRVTVASTTYPMTENCGPSRVSMSQRRAGPVRLLALLENGYDEARMEVVAERATTSTRNVVGELAGVDDEWVVIGTHHDAPWASAVEDGTGLAMLLAQAAAWAAKPESPAAPSLGVPCDCRSHVRCRRYPIILRAPPHDARADCAGGPPRARCQGYSSRSAGTRGGEHACHATLVVPPPSAHCLSRLSGTQSWSTASTDPSS